MSLPPFTVPVLVLALLVTFLFRLQYGVNLNDESFYLSMPYSMTLGAVPFRDEWRIHQTAGLLLVPLVALHRAIVGSSFGIVLAGRLWYLLGALLIAFTTFRLLRKDFGRDTALFAALFPVLSVPFSLFAWSYNSFAGQFLLLLLLLGWSGRREPRHLYAAGVFGALTVWVYPPLAIAVFLLTGMIVYHHRGNLRPTLGRFVAGGATVAVPALIGLALVGMESLQRCFEFSASVTQQSWTFGRFFLLFPSYLAALGPRREVWPVLALVVGLVLFRRGWLGVGALLLLGVTLTRANEVGHLGSLGLNIRLALLAWLFYPAMQRPETRSLFLWVGLPSVIAGSVCAMTSTNFLVNAGVGMLPGAVVFVVAMGDLLRRNGAILASAMIFAFLTWHHWGSHQPLFRERDIGELTARVPSGPFAGTRTTPTMAAFLARLEPQLKALASSASSISIFTVPAGYLFTALPAGVPTTWLDGVEKLLLDSVRWFERHDDGKAAFVWMKATPDSPFWGEVSVPPDDPVMNWVIAHRARIYESSEFVVFQGPISARSQMRASDLPARSEAAGTPAASGTGDSQRR